MCRSSYEEVLDPKKLDPRSALASIESAFRGAEKLAAANPKDFQANVNQLRLAKLYATVMRGHGIDPGAMLKSAVDRARGQTLMPATVDESDPEQLRRVYKIQRMVLELESMIARPS